MNNKKHNSKRTDEKSAEQVPEQERQNQNTNETSEFTSNTSASTSSSVTTSPSAENKIQNIDESNVQTVVNNDHSPSISQNQMITQTPIPIFNYFPYIQGSNTFANPLDFNSANWSQTMAMTKNGLTDPISVAAYINTAGYNPAEIASFDQFGFTYPQAYGFGFGNPQISPITDFQQNHRNYGKRHNLNSNSNNIQYQNFYQNNSHNQKTKPNKIESEFNSLSLNEHKNSNNRNFKSYRNNQNYNNNNNKNTKRNNLNYVNNQSSYADNENLKLNENDNKSWSNISGPNAEISSQMEQNRFFNNQFNYHLNQPCNNFSSYAMPEHFNESKQSYNIENQYDKQIFKGMNSNQNQHEFNIDNNSFPPINSNNESQILQESTSRTNIPYENQNQSNYTFNKNFYKRQQYNNYQKQQQKQFGTLTNFYSNIEPDFNTYHISDNQEKSNGNIKKQFSEEDSYYKPQHPPQLKISSFMTNLDKKFFMDDEKKNDTNPVQIDLKPNKIDTSSYNPIEFNITPISARFFVIKSYSEDDVFASIKHNVWCSTEHGNRRLNSAYIKGEGNTPVYLFFSVNGSRHFCGMAEMRSRVDFSRRTELWSQDKWRGCFQVKWIYVKDVPNSLLRNIKLENNDNKPVTNSRDTQEIPFDKGIQVLKVFHTFKHTSSIFDDFDHYENTRQEEDAIAKAPLKIQDSKSESQLIIPVKNDSSSSSMCSPDSSSSYGSNTNPNTDVHFDRLNQPEFIHANIGQI